MSDARPIWVTGAAGFLGGAVCRRLAAAGRAVQPVLRPGGRFEGGGAALPALHCDLTDDCPRPSADDLRPSTVVHFAAEIPAGGDDQQMAAVAARNRRIDDNVFALAAAVAADVVFASSGSVYGAGSGQIFAEDGPTAPAIAYAAAKLRSEQEGATVVGSAGGSFAALRISAPYGPGLSASTVARLFLTRALAGEPLTYHGEGSRMQDFVYVTDVAEAVESCVSQRACGVFNIASGAPVSMKELAALVADVVGGTVSVRSSGAPDEQEGRSARYSIDAAATTLGWRPATTLRRGLEAWRDHIREHGA